MSVLRVSPEAVEQSGGQVAGASTAAVPAAQVTAAASDPVSVSVAHALGMRIAVIGAAKQHRPRQTERAAAHLTANATDYVTQERANTTAWASAGLPEP